MASMDEEKANPASSREPSSPIDGLGVKTSPHDIDDPEPVSPENADGPSRASNEWVQRVYSNPNPSVAPSERPPLPLRREIPFVALVCCAQLFVQASLGQAVAILPYMSPTFGGLSNGELSWIPAAFSLTTGTFIIICGRIGDIVGHKLLFIIGWTWMAVATLLAGLSALTHQQIFFDVCRALQGIAAAILLPSALALLGSIYPPGARKAYVFALFGATAPNGALIGSVFAGIFAQFAWWPWTFWTTSIVSTVIAVLCVWVIPDPPDDTSSMGPQKFDWIGAFTGVAGLILFNVAWNQGPVVGWRTPYVIVLLILGLLFMGGFLWYELRLDQPLIPVRGMSGEVGFVLGCVGLGWASFGVFFFYFWQFLENLRHISPLLAVAQLSPVGPAGIVAALLTGFLMSRVKPELIMAVALCAFCLGNTLLATMSVDQTYWAETFLATIFTPFGMDMSFPAATLVLSNSVPKRQQGIAASLVITVVNYSISIGLGLGATVESHVNPDQRPDRQLLGYRSALYSGIGMAACGIVLSIAFVLFMAHKRKTTAKA